MTVVKHFLLIAALILIAATASGQQKEEASEPFTTGQDTNYIVDYKHLLTSRFFLLAQNVGFSIFPDNGNQFIYRPNETGRFGVAAFYSWFGLGLSVGTKLFRKNPDIYGSTKTYDFRVNAYSKFGTFEGYYQYYQGLYLNYKSTDLKETYIIPGMDIISIGFEANYIYNYGKFSIRASFVQNERQKKSAGSLVVKPSFRYYYVNSDTGIIPGAILSQHQMVPENLVSGNFYTFGLGPGYIYSFIFLRNCYITVGGMIEMNWSKYDYTTTLGTEANSGFSFPTSFRIAAGYNSDVWFIGASYISTPFNFRPQDGFQDDFHYSLTQIRFWVGTRFDAFKKWKRKK